MSVLKKIYRKAMILMQLFLSNVSYVISGKGSKIIVGVTEIANILHNMKYLFNENCITVCKNNNPFYIKNNYDVDISNKPEIIKRIYSAILFGKLAKKARFFLYIWCDGFLIDREYDFKFLKKHNIPIVCFFVGSDIRSEKLLLEYCKKIQFDTFVEYNNKLSDEYDKAKMKIAKLADEYAHIVFSYPLDQMSYLKSKQNHFPPIVSETLFSFNSDKFTKRPIRILHAPSKPILKGTPLIRSVIKMLKYEGYEFDYIEITNVSNDVVISELHQSHIVLNQFYTFAPGIFGLEAMATGNAVLMSAKHNCYPYEFSNAWFETENWQLYYNLKYLLENPDKIMEYAKNGYEYMLKNFTTEEIKKYIFNLFKEKGFPIDS